MTKPFADLIGKPEDQPKCPCEAQAQLTTISVKMSTANERIRRALPRVLKHYESRINSYRRQIILVMYVILVVNSWGTIVTLPWLNPVFPYSIVLMSYFAALALNIRMWKKWGFRFNPMDRSIYTVAAQDEEADAYGGDLEELEKRLTFLMIKERYQQNFCVGAHCIFWGSLIGCFMTLTSPALAHCCFN
ncbi:unnamed protein product [Caenorhabditis brenneri]